MFFGKLQTEIDMNIDMEIWKHVSDLQPEGHRQIYNMVKHLPHSSNQSGFYFDLTRIPPELLTKLKKFLTESKTAHDEFLRGQKERDGFLYELQKTIGGGKLCIGGVNNMVDENQVDDACSIIDDSNIDSDDDGGEGDIGDDDTESYDNDGCADEVGEIEGADEAFERETKEYNQRWALKKKVWSKIYYPSKRWPDVMQRERDRDYKKIIDTYENSKRKTVAPSTFINRKKKQKLNDDVKLKSNLDRE